MPNWKRYEIHGGHQALVNLDQATVIKPNAPEWTRIEFPGDHEAHVIVKASINQVMSDA